MDPFEAEFARESIETFCTQFGAAGSRLYRAYRDFARHAALPLTFNADLLYRLQERFRSDMRGRALHIPWVAVADLILSHLCHEVRSETFRLDAVVRLLLLEELQTDRARFWLADGGRSRLQEVANFIADYAAHQLNHPSHYVREAAKAQRLNAQVISQPKLVRDLLQEAAVSLLPQQEPTATLRVASLVSTFNASVNLTRAETDATRQDFNQLNTYTGGLAQLVQGGAVTAVSQQFTTAFGSDSNIQIGGQTLPSLRQLIGEPEPPTPGDRYDNFDIHIGQPLPGPDMRYPVTVSSAAGVELQDVEQTFAPVGELSQRLAHLRDLVSNPEETAEIGQLLFRVLLREPNYELLQRNFASAQSRGKAGLRLRLRFDDPALQAYPWELCHNDRSFIFNNPEQPILLIRSVSMPSTKITPPLPRPTRLLVVIAAPVDQGRADVDMQEKIIRQATEEVASSGELEMQIMRHATLGKLDSMVASFQPNIVHFIGNSSSKKDGALILENEKGRSNIVPISEIMRILQPAPVQCVILSPIGVEVTASTQLAPQFIQQGIPTVLAEQFALPDQPAVEFMRTFYRTLLFDRLSFEESVWNGRQQLKYLSKRNRVL